MNLVTGGRQLAARVALYWAANACRSAVVVPLTPFAEIAPGARPTVAVPTPQERPCDSRDCRRAFGVPEVSAGVAGATGFAVESCSVSLTIERSSVTGALGVDVTVTPAAVGAVLVSTGADEVLGAACSTVWMVATTPEAAAGVGWATGPVTTVVLLTGAETFAPAATAAGEFAVIPPTNGSASANAAANAADRTMSRFMIVHPPGTRTVPRMVRPGTKGGPL